MLLRPAKKSKAGWRKEWMIVVMLLILPVAGSIYVLQPINDQFLMQGDLVSVQEAGVDGSVYFVTVNEGKVKDRFEKWIAQWRHAKDKIEFYEKDQDVDIEQQAELLVKQELMREETLANAVAATVSVNTSSEDMVEDRIAELIQRTAEYYGDSFGLMIAIGLYEEEQGIDFSQFNKYKIAGTGALNEDGSVGSIGGLKFKLLEAEENGVDYFFVPQDDELYGEESNWAEAKRVKDHHHMSLQLVPVKNLNEAIDYLNNLP